MGGGGTDEPAECPGRLPGRFRLRAPVSQNGQALTTTQVTIRLGRRTVTGVHHPGTTLLETARSMGLTPPSSCEQGNCATCMARIEEGSAPMRVNDALDDDDIEEGWVLTCQAVPEGPSVSVVYE